MWIRINFIQDLNDILRETYEQAVLYTLKQFCYFRFIYGIPRVDFFQKNTFFNFSVVQEAWEKRKVSQIFMFLKVVIYYYSNYFPILNIII